MKQNQNSNQAKTSSHHDPHQANPSKDDDKIKEAELAKTNDHDEDLKPTNKISENIHVKPAEEQQFEKDD